MSCNMVEVTLHGHLADRFGGQVRRYRANSAAEVIRALKANLPGWQSYLMEHRLDPFHVLADEDGLGEREMYQPRPLRRLRIVPAVVGAKSDGVQMLVGAVLVVIGAVTAYYFGPNPISQGLITMGAGMILGGVAQMFAQTPGLDKPNEKAANQPNYIFNGPVNMAAQGQPIPMGYGRLEVGSVVIAGDITLDKPAGSWVIGTGGGGGTGGGDDGGCPAPWEPVMTPEGEIRAGDLKAGMQVLTFSEDELQFGPYEVEAVAPILSERWDIVTPKGARHTFSPKHRIWARKQGTAEAAWAQLMDLEPGDVAAGMIDQRVAYAHLRDVGPVMRIKVKGARTYIAGGMLSHNTKLLGGGVTDFTSGDDGSSTYTYGGPI